MKYKLIACDMDETFLNDESEIPKKNKEIIEILDEEYGIKFVPASGRGINSLQREIKSLGFDKKSEEYIIGLNGASICETKGKKILYFSGLSFDIANKIFKLGLEKNICIHIYANEELYTYNLNHDERNALLLKGMSWIDIESKDIDFLKNASIAKVLYEDLDMEYLEGIKEELYNILGDSVNYTYSSNRYLEMNGKNVSKGEGLKKLCEILNIPIEETIAIGDNHNDMDMLEVAGLSIAVSNGVEEVKNIVDYVAKSSNNDGVLEEIYNKFIKK